MNEITTQEEWFAHLRQYAACVEALNAGLGDAFHKQRMKAYLQETAKAHGTEMVNTVVATAINMQARDGRYDRSVKRWAAKVPQIPHPPGSHEEGVDRTMYIKIVNTHPLILNEAAKELREMDLQRGKRTERVR